MLETGITPDFIVVDGAEGGTGAAPLEFTDHVGAPLQEGLLLVHNTLVGLNLRDKIRVGCAGKVVSAFDIARMLALGADWCNAARGFMFALGCIQAQTCHTGNCPTGVTTQDPKREKALVVPTKAERVYHFHQNTMMALKELVQAAGLKHPSEIDASHIVRRGSEHGVKLLVEPAAVRQARLAARRRHVAAGLPHLLADGRGEELQSGRDGLNRGPTTRRCCGAKSAGARCRQVGGRVSMKLWRASSLSASRARFLWSARQSIVGKAELQIAERAADRDVGERQVDAGAVRLVGEAGADRRQRRVDLAHLAVDPGLAALAFRAPGPGLSRGAPGSRRRGCRRRATPRSAPRCGRGSTPGSGG